MLETIVVGNRKLTYDLLRKKVKNINLRIKPDGTILVSASPRVSKKYIQDFIISKIDWIDKTLQHFEQQERLDKREFQIKDGETLKLLGKEYTIVIIPSKEYRIEILESNIVINIKNPEDTNVIKRTWEKWLNAYIDGIFRDVVDEIYPLFIKYNIKMPKLRFRYMKTRWGTCSLKTGTITLNKTLIHAPKECIEYVVAHEFTHFLHPNHSKAFYQALSLVMPDYKVRILSLKKSF